MSILEILRAPWAIAPDKLAEIQAIYDTHLRGDKIDIAAVEARLGHSLQNEPAAYTVQDGGVAVLNIDGVIAPKANLFTRISGGVSAQMAEQAVLDAMADPAVRSLLLAIDSPGGSVHGTPEVGAAIRQFAEKKPVVALATATMASAAYWLGSSANAVYISGPTCLVGSIGVVATHNYTPNAGGSVQTEIAAGQYKRIATTNAPLTKEGRAYMQAQVDHLYQVFVDAVSANRGASVEDVLAHMADGRVFVGQQAIDAGLVDGVSTMSALLEGMATQPDRYAQRRKAQFAVTPPSKGAGAAPKDKPPVKGKSMSDETITRASLEQDHAPLFAQVKAEFTALGAQQERDRIAGVRAQGLPGHEALIDKLAMDGKTSPGEAAMAVNAAQREEMNAKAKALDSDAPAAAKASAAPQDKPVKKRAEHAEEAKAYAAEHGVDFVSALKKLGYA